MSEVTAGRIDKAITASELQSDIAVLVCPMCGDEYLHHGTVRVLGRENGEDSHGGVVTVKGLDATFVSLSAAQLPGRRHSVEIDFRCEGCSKGERLMTLRIEQHKGNTHMYWTRWKIARKAD